MNRRLLAIPAVALSLLGLLAAFAYHRQRNIEEEVYENYRLASGIMAPYNVTRYSNGDMASQRFLNSVTIDQGLDQAMFDPNSGYNPNKTPAKR